MRMMSSAIPILHTADCCAFQVLAVILRTERRSNNCCCTSLLLLSRGHFIGTSRLCSLCIRIRHCRCIRDFRGIGLKAHLASPLSTTPKARKPHRSRHSLACQLLFAL
ncbi:MAG: hypothetical protein [Caudoviricetes sp.]|nr:MAG: hypothetical protein [Caudoviricetes sp.]